MSRYQVELFSFTGQHIGADKFEAQSEREVKSLLQTAIARVHARPNSYVYLDLEKRTYTIGAGFWSHKGAFEISAINP